MTTFLKIATIVYKTAHISGVRSIDYVAHILVVSRLRSAFYRPNRFLPKKALNTYIYTYL